MAINQTLIEKSKLIMEKYKQEGFLIVGLSETMGVSDRFDSPELPSHDGIDVYYHLSSEIWTKYPGPAFFRLFNDIEKQFKTSLGVSVDLVDTDSLGVIGQEGILSKIQYIDY